MNPTNARMDDMASRSLHSACAIDRDRIALLCYNDHDEDYEGPHKVIFADARVGAPPPRSIERVGENIRLCRYVSSGAAIAILSRRGSVEILSFSGATVSLEKTGSSLKYGFLNGITCIDGDLYVCGMGGQVYHRSSDARWKLVSREILATDVETNWLSYIDGKTNSYLFADGPFGVLYYFNGKSWQKLKSGTDHSIGEFAFLKDGRVLIAGAQSTFVVGDVSKGFAAVKTSPPDLTMYAISSYQDQIYVGTDRGVFLYEVNNNRLSRVTPLLENVDIFALQAIDDVLWCFGAKTIWRFDGKQKEIFDKFF